MLLVLNTLLVANGLFAQTAGKISGVVRDAQTSEPLIGANILIVGEKWGATTDLEGSYFILNIPPGKYNLRVSILGYQGMIQQDVIVNSNRTTTVDFSLKATTIEQEAVIVQAERPDVQREKTSTSEIIRSEDVFSLAGMRDVSDVIGLAADVTDGHFRGGRSNEEYYTLQGLGIMNPLDASSAFTPIMSAVEEIEVVTSGFDAQYGNAQSGIINITMKEGKSDKWRSKLEVRMRAPGLKYFGPSVFDASAQPYLQKLSDPNFWRYGDASTGGISILGWSTMDFGGDTAVMIQATQAIWKSATQRDMNRTYWNTVDYSVEGATGGPLFNGVTMFTAFRSQVDNPIVPTEEPNTQQQVMGNFVFDIGEGAALRLSGGYQYQFDNVFSSGTGFYQWVWDRILGISYRKRTNIQIGTRFTQAFSQRSFMEIKLNVLNTQNRVGTSPWYDTVTDAVRGMETGSAIITRTMNFMYYQSMPATGKVFFYLANNMDDFINEKTTTISLDASYTSQITKSHLINGGIQGNYYALNVNNVRNIASKGNIAVTKYTGNPYELGLFLQDKMEYEGMIAKVGLRWDAWNSNTSYYVDQFDPFVVVDAQGNPTGVVDPNLAPKEQSKIVARLQPRVGISFPVSEATVFHLNYGTFMQRPSFQYVMGTATKMPPPGLSITPNSLANPRLNPQVTNSYDIGIMQGLGEGFILDVSGYYKDIKDQLEQAVYTNEKTLTSYFSYFNRDYADVRGFRLSLAKRKSALTGSVNYQFSVATGKSASASNAPVSIKKDIDGVVSTDAVTKVPIRDVLLNFDRTHNLILNLAYRTDEEFGFSLFEEYPLGNIAVSVSSFARSGRPYTPPGNARDVNSLRSPAEYNTNFKVTKVIQKFFGTTATVYAEVFNIFDQKILNYNYLFNAANKVDQNMATERYLNHPFDDPASGVLYWDDLNNESAYSINHSFMLYDNAPRTFNFGLVVDF
jgi:hypothetical protein